MTEQTTPPGGGRAAARLGLVLAVLGVVWMAAELWAAYRQISAGAGDSVALAAAALSLPAVLQSTVLAGVGTGMAARHAVARAGSGDACATVPRWVAAPAGGLLVGLAGTAAILSVYGDVTSTVRIAVTVAVAGLLGGALAALPRRPIVTVAGLLAALGGFLLDTVLNSDTVLGGMMAGFGGRASATPDHIVTASSLVAHVDSVLVGIVAGLLAFWCLHRYASLRFPAYQAAGALTGVVLVLAEILVATGGGDLLHAARSISPADQTVLDLLDSARIVNSLLVLFIGTLVAMIAFGRTLGPRRATAADDPAADDPAARDPAEDEDLKAEPGAEPDEPATPPAQRNS